MTKICQNMIVTYDLMGCKGVWDIDSPMSGDDYEKH